MTFFTTAVYPSDLGFSDTSNDLDYLYLYSDPSKQGMKDEPEKKPVAEYSAMRKGKDPVMIITLKASLIATLSTSSSRDLSFLTKSGSLNGVGGGIGMGVAVDIIPMPYIAIETGIYLRTFTLIDVTYSEYMIPLLVKFRVPIKSWITVLIGGGPTYFDQFSGQINPEGTGPGQGSIELNKQDLREGYGFIAKAQMQLLFRTGLVFSVDFGYEYAKRSLDIKSNDVFLNVGVGFVIF